jgi:hypothetical protein
MTMVAKMTGNGCPDVWQWLPKSLLMVAKRTSYSCPVELNLNLDVIFPFLEMLVFLG